MAAALALARFRRSVGLFNSGKPRVSWAPRLHNLIGFPKGISGEDLLRRFSEHLRKYPEISRFSKMVVVRRHGRGFSIHPPAGKPYHARKVILATGVQDRQPNLPNLDRLRKSGHLRYCSICDGYEMEKKVSAVLVCDEPGLQKALYLSQWSKKMKILAPEELKISEARSAQISGIGAEILRCRDFSLAEGEYGRKIQLSLDGGKPIQAGVVYVELGADVNAEAFRRLRGLRRIEGDFLETTPQQRTSIRGLFAVGDCVNGLGQVAVATGQASVAAAQVHDELSCFR